MLRSAINPLIFFFFCVCHFVIVYFRDRFLSQNRIIPNWLEDVRRFLDVKSLWKLKRSRSYNEQRIDKFQAHHKTDEDECKKVSYKTAVIICLFSLFVVSAQQISACLSYEIRIKVQQSCKSENNKILLIACHIQQKIGKYHIL